MKQVTSKSNVPTHRFAGSFLGKIFQALMGKVGLPKSELHSDRGSHLCQPFGGKKGRHTSARHARLARKARRVL